MSSTLVSFVTNEYNFCYGGNEIPNMVFKNLLKIKLLTYLGIYSFKNLTYIDIFNACLVQGCVECSQK